MRKFKSLILPCAIFTAAVSATAAAAYYDAMISHETCLVKAADISFGSSEGISSDLSSQNNRLLPFEEGESFDISFSTRYDGDIAAYAVPSLKTFISGMDKDDIIRISDGKNDICIDSSGSGMLYSDIALLKPGDVIEKNYHITVVKHSGTKPLKLGYEFSLAAVQKKGNEMFIENGISSEDLYGAITNRNGLSGEIKGFSELITKRDGAAGSDEEGGIRYYSVRLTPQTEKTTSNSETYKWYVKTSDTDEKIISSNETLELTINKYNISDGLSVRYEVANEAGYISSKRYIFEINADELECRTEDFVYE